MLPEELEAYLGGFIVKQLQAKDQIVSPFRIVHWRLPSASESIYGKSVLEAARDGGDHLGSFQGLYAPGFVKGEQHRRFSADGRRRQATV